MAEYIDKNSIAYRKLWDCDETGTGIPVMAATSEEISAVPPADVRLVVHGKWEDEQPGPWGTVYATCPACRLRMTLDAHAHSFCPSCGADVRPEPSKEETK